MRRGAVSVVITVAVIGLVVLHLSGDLAAAIAGPDSSAADIEAIRIQYGLDSPVIEQFSNWFSGAVWLNFGQSYYFPNSVSMVILLLSLLLSDRFAIVTHSVTQQLRDAQFIAAVKTRGASTPYLLLREMLPNITGALTVVATLEIAQAIY